MRLLAAVLSLCAVVVAQPKPESKVLPLADLLKWQKGWEDMYEAARAKGNPIATKDVLTRRAAEVDTKMQGAVYEGTVIITEIRAGTKSKPAMLYFNPSPAKETSFVRMKNFDDPALVKLARGKSVLLRAVVAPTDKGRPGMPLPPDIMLILKDGEVFPGAPKDK